MKAVWVRWVEGSAGLNCVELGDQGSSCFIQSCMGNRWGGQSTEIVSFGLLKNSLWSR